MQEVLSYIEERAEEDEEEVAFEEKVEGKQKSKKGIKRKKKGQLSLTHKKYTRSKKEKTVPEKGSGMTTEPSTEEPFGEVA